MTLEVHPLVKSLELPMMSVEEFRSLCVDMREKGQHDPIVLHEGKILDGDHRYQACQIENIEPKLEDYAGDDPLGFVISKNLMRRHLTTEDRKRIAAKLFEQNPSRTDRSVARQTGIDNKTAARVRRETETFSSNEEFPHKETTGITDAPGLSPKEDILPPLPAPPAPRVESGGRGLARGRKPGAVMPPREVKPKSTAPKPREEWLFAGAALFEADPQQHGDDLVSIFVNCSGLLRETVKESTRQEWLEKIAVALGFRFTQAADA